MLKTLIFDWDGTLHNTELLYVNGFRKVYDKLLVKGGWADSRSFRNDEITCWLGMNPPDMWNAFMPSLPDEIKERASSGVEQAMLDGIEAGDAELYPGVPETLEKLKAMGLQLVFLSNCKRSYMEAHRRHWKLESYFDGFYCCEDYGYVPKPEIFKSIKLSFPGDYAVIGDRRSDLETAYVHGLHSVGCTYGFGSREELKDAEYIAESVTDLPAIIKKLL